MLVLLGTPNIGLFANAQRNLIALGTPSQTLPHSVTSNPVKSLATNAQRNLIALGTPTSQMLPHPVKHYPSQSK